MKVVIIMKNHTPIAYANTLTDAKNKVVKKLGYEGLTWEHVCRLTNCATVYNFVEVTENI